MRRFPEAGTALSACGNRTAECIPPGAVACSDISAHLGPRAEGEFVKRRP